MNIKSGVDGGQEECHIHGLDLHNEGMKHKSFVCLFFFLFVSDLCDYLFYGSQGPSSQN